MSASKELRKTIDMVAAGTLDPERATAAISRWIVVAVESIGNAGGLDVAKLVGEAAEQEREACARIAESVPVADRNPALVRNEIVDKIRAHVPLTAVAERTTLQVSGGRSE